MTRKLMIVDTYYLSLLNTLGLDRVLGAGADYATESGRALDFGFGTGAAYARGLREAGWDAQVVVANSLALQDLWARDHGTARPLPAGWNLGPYLARLPVARNQLHRLRHLHRVLLDQVRTLKPDVVMVQDLNIVTPALAKAMKKHTGLLFGEIASPLPPSEYLTSYDFIVSALPTIVERAESLGIPASFIPLGFDSRWAASTPASQRPIDAIFVGSFTRLQPSTAPLLREVSKRVPGLQIYGSAKPGVLDDAGLAEFYRGPAWGRDMFALLAQSKLVVNRHGAIAGDYAVNMRMYEATGAGALLLTERKSNLDDLFRSGEQALAYTSAAEAAQLAADVLADPERLDRIASAGNARTLSAHTYHDRARALTSVIDGHLAGR